MSNLGFKIRTVDCLDLRHCTSTGKIAIPICMKDGKIKKCILVDGKFDSGRPKPGDTVLVKVQGKLKDGTIVDDYPTLVFTIGEYEVIDGLDLVVQSMYRNELSIVSIKPEMAYGEQGKHARNLDLLREIKISAKSIYV